MSQNEQRRPVEDAAARLTLGFHGTTPGGVERLLTAAELGKYLCLTTGTILDRFERGDLPGYRLFRKGGPVRFRADEVEAWLDSCRVEQTPTQAA